MTTSLEIKDCLTKLLADHLGKYSFEGIGVTPAISLLQKGEPIAPRQIDGLECIVLAMPQITQKFYEFEIILKFWKDLGDYDLILSLIKEELPIVTVSTLNVRENPELLAAVVIKTKIPIMFED